MHWFKNHQNGPQNIARHFKHDKATAHKTYNWDIRLGDAKTKRLDPFQQLFVLIEGKVENYVTNCFVLKGVQFYWHDIHKWKEFEAIVNTLNKMLFYLSIFCVLCFIFTKRKRANFIPLHLVYTLNRVLCIMKQTYMFSKEKVYNESLGWNVLTTL